MLNKYLKLNVLKVDNPGYVPEQFLKYVPLNRGMNDLPSSVVPIVNSMVNLVREVDNRDICIDYKVRNLSQGDFGSGLSAWHLDCTNDIHSEFKPETHAIYASCFGTHFANKPIDRFKYTNLGELISNESIDSVVADEGYIHMYDSHTLHRCPIVNKECQRILIRITAGFFDRVKYNKARNV